MVGLLGVEPRPPRVRAVYAALTPKTIWGDAGNRTLAFRFTAESATTTSAPPLAGRDLSRPAQYDYWHPLEDSNPYLTV